MKPLAKICDLLLDVCLHRLLLGPRIASIFPLRSAAVVANNHVEIGDLVRILAWSGYLDWASPVEVAVAQSEGQLLNLHFEKGRLVEWDEAVSGQDAALVGRSRGDEEIEGLGRVSSATFVLYEASVDDATIGRILELSTTVTDKESLVDPFVDNDESHLWRGCRCGSRLLLLLHSVNLRVQVFDGRLKLSDLNADHLVSLSLANSISKDNKVGGKFPIMTLFEGTHSLAQRVLELLVDDLLTT